MAKATTKEDLLVQANTQFDKLIKLIDSMPLDEQEEEFKFDITNEKEAHWARDKNIRDVLIHLYEWHQLLLNWVNNNMNDIRKPFLMEPYNWKNYGEMNVQLWKKHQNTSYIEAKEMIKESHGKVIELIESFSNDELFARNKFSWVGGSTMGQYCSSVTSSHYDWAMKKVKKQIKALVL